jgi:allantoin racemase
MSEPNHGNVGINGNARIALVVPITTAGFRSADQFEPYLPSGVSVDVRQISEGPASIESEYDDMLAVPDVVRVAREAESDGANAVVIDCMADPGLQAVREMLTIPAFGPGQTSMHVAAMLGHKFGFLTILPNLIPSVERHVAMYGLSSKLAGVASIDVPVLQLEDDEAVTLKAMTEKSIDLIDRTGAHSLVLGCTGLLWAASRLEESLAKAGYEGVPVVNPIPTTLNVAAALGRLGLTHSGLTYPTPPEKRQWRGADRSKSNAN